MRLTDGVILVGAALFVGGCAGARASLTLPDARYPVSLSHGMLGPNREMLTASEMKHVGHFHDETSAWGTFYSLIPFTPHLDMSDAVNRQVTAAQGQAIIELRTASRPCALDYFFLLNFLPIWPGCANVAVDGEIVTYVAPAPPPPPALPAPPPPAPEPPPGVRPATKKGR